MPYFEQPTASATFRPTEPVNTTPIVSSTPRPTAVVETVTIFGDALNQNWTVDNSYLFDSERDIDVSYNGRYSLAATPRVANAQLIFAVAPDADEEYLRDDVLAVRFWLYSGDDYIATDDLSVTVLGSNEFPYWVEDDDSVQVADDSLPTFSQTRLYFLNVDEDIPPDTWIQIEVWLDDLIFDPDYRYVTGLIIENDDDFIRTIYIDDLELLIEA